jgi:nitroreductase
MSFIEQLALHRSIRHFTDEDVPTPVIERLLAAAMRGSPSSGNFNAYSVVLTRDSERKRRLWELHRRQGAVAEAPLLLTFCADFHRFRRWLRLSGAPDNFDNFLGFLVAEIDAIILAQTFALAAEAEGLGICYLGTTLEATREIAEALSLPKTVFPAIALALGHPAEAPAARDRLPLSGILHEERYVEQDDAGIAAIYAEKERRGFERYAGEASRASLLQATGSANLAQFYMSELKYSPERIRLGARSLLDHLYETDFMNNGDEETNP